MIKSIEKLKETINLRKYNKERMEYLKSIICDIGTITEEDDKIICYVDKKKLENYKGGRTTYNLRLSGLNKVYEESKRQIKQLNLDKEVYYVFDGIEFDYNLELSCRFGHVIFKNCTFKNGIKIPYANEVVFTNNKYNNPINSSRFLLLENIKKLVFVNDNVENINSNIIISADFLEIIDSSINIANNFIDITSNQVTVYNSKISFDSVQLYSKNIQFISSTLKAKGGVLVKNDGIEFDGNIISPFVLYNGDEISNASEMMNPRKEYIESLRNLSDYYKKICDIPCNEKLHVKKLVK